MGENSKIEWTTHTFNPWIGCQKVGPGCDFCYAEDMMDKRYGRVEWGPHGDRIRTAPANWRKPLAWDKAAIGATERPRVFCASLADWADTHKSIPHGWREDLGDLIEATPNLDWLLLTKRIGNADECLGEMFTYAVPKNVCIGITVVNQSEADRDIPKLIALKAKRDIGVVFLSCEPLLGPIELWNADEGVLRGCAVVTSGGVTVGTTDSPAEGYDDSYIGIDWVIVGGESGASARPMHPDWARSLRDQCAAADVPFLFKQWGEWGPYDRSRHDGAILATPFSTDMPLQRFGKKLAGRLLDGTEHNGVPH
jgi:protein gp37